MDTQQKIAQALLKIGAVNFVLDNPVTFKSGIISPVYVDNMIIPFYPNEWRVVIEAFADQIKNNNLGVDVVAGVEHGPPEIRRQR